jgi:site-specific recombinase XerD
MNASLVSTESSVSATIDVFLAYKRALNRKYRTEELALRLFESFMTSTGIECFAAVASTDIERFLASRHRKKPRSYNHLLGVLRNFFRWLLLQGVVATTPVIACPRRNTGQRRPYLFDLEQARALLAVVRALPDNPRALKRGVSYETMFALLYGLGLRVGEVSRLTVGDLDLTREVLVIRNTKFSKDRLVPFGPRMSVRLRHYIEERFGSAMPAADHPLFSFTRGQPVNPGTISLLFHHLVPKLNLEDRPEAASPRLHDLRHSFAVRTLLHWYRSGIDPNLRLLHLSTFLGHVDPESTAVYLTITDELLDEANGRFHDFAKSLLNEEGLP